MGDGKAAQWLAVIVPLPEDQSLSPQTLHQVPLLPKIQHPLPTSPGTHTHRNRDRDTQTQVHAER